MGHELLNFLSDLCLNVGVNCQVVYHHLRVSGCGLDACNEEWSEIIHDFLWGWNCILIRVLQLSFAISHNQALNDVRRSGLVRIFLQNLADLLYPLGYELQSPCFISFESMVYLPLLFGNAQSNKLYPQDIIDGSQYLFAGILNEPR